MRGLTGGFPSVLERRPLEAVIERYARNDDRDLRRYRLELSAEQRVRFLTRLEEIRQGWQRPYLYLSRNCTALPLELVHAALDGEFHPPFPLAPDVLLGMLDWRGLLQPVALERPEEAALSARAATADRLRSAQARELRRLDRALAPAFEGAAARKPEKRVAAYAALGATETRDLSTLHQLDLYLAWSDAVEQQRVSREPSTTEDPVVQSIRSAKASLRRRAGALGSPVSAFSSGQPELIAALSQPRDHMGRHSPMRTIESWARAAPGAGGVPYFGVGSAFWRSRIGEPRRYGVSVQSGYTLLQTTWFVSTEGVLHSDSLLARIEQFSPGRQLLARGYYLELLRMNHWVPLEGEGSVRWGELGGLVGLWRGREGGPMLWASGGLAVDGEVDKQLGAELPIGLVARLDSRRQTLSGLSLEARLAPRLSLAGELSTRATGELQARVRLGELAGADLGLMTRGRLVGDAAWGGPWSWSPELAVGLRVERL